MVEAIFATIPARLSMKIDNCKKAIAKSRFLPMFINIPTSNACKSTVGHHV